MRAEAHFPKAPPRSLRAVGGVFREFVSRAESIAQAAQAGLAGGKRASLVATLAACAAFAARGAIASATASAQELTAPPDRVLAAVAMRYAGVTNLSCTVRRTARIEGIAETPPESISRIIWGRGGKLDARRLAPEARRTVIDGKFVRTAAEGEREPVTFPVAEQLPTQAANLRSVPGSPEETLYALDPESGREAAVAECGATGEFKTSEGSARDGKRVATRAVAFSFKRETTMPADAEAVVTFDENGTVVSVDISCGSSADSAKSTTRFLSPIEPFPGIVLFQKIETSATANGQIVVTTAKFERIAVNSALPADAFDAEAAFGKACAAGNNAKP